MLQTVFSCGSLDNCVRWLFIRIFLHFLHACSVTNTQQSTNIGGSGTSTFLIKVIPPFSVSVKSSCPSKQEVYQPVEDRKEFKSIANEMRESNLGCIISVKGKIDWLNCLRKVENVLAIYNL